MRWADRIKEVEVPFPQKQSRVARGQAHLCRRKVKEEYDELARLCLRVQAIQFLLYH